jgi:hypothetical protein
MDRHQRAELDRHLTTEPAWRTEEEPPEEVELDLPDACPRCDCLGYHEDGCLGATLEAAGYAPDADPGVLFDGLT